MRPVAALLGLCLAGLPLLTLPSRATGAASAVVAVVCAAGIVTLARPLATLGGGLALLEYATALTIAGGRPDVVGATAFGVALLLWLLTVDFARRVAGAALGPRVVATQVRYWVGLGAMSAAAVMALTGAALLLGRIVPFSTRPAVIALGVLTAFVGASRAPAAVARTRP